MLSFQEIQVPDKQVTLIECDSCHTTATPETVERFQSFVWFRIPFGYGSKYDREVHRFQLCEACYDKMLAAMQIAPAKTEYIIGSGEDPRTLSPNQSYEANHKAFIQRLMSAGWTATEAEQEWCDIQTDAEGWDD